MKESNLIVKKHNKLIEGKAEHMDIRELRIIAQIASMITIDDKDFKTYQVPLKKIERNNIHYTEIKEIVKKLVKRAVYIEEIDDKGKNEITGYTIMSKVKYKEGTGFIESQFHPDLKSYYLELKNNFTQFKCETLMKIPSTYSYRIYELLKQYQQGGIKERLFEIVDLQEKLSINSKHAKSYIKWGNFKDKVLTPAKRHLEKYTDITFNYDAWSEHGRSFTNIKFNIESTRKQLKLPFKTIKKAHSLDKKTIEKQLEVYMFHDLKELKIMADKGDDEIAIKAYEIKKLQ